MGQARFKIVLVGLNCSDPSAAFRDGVSLGLYTLRAHAHRSPEIRQQVSIEIVDVPLTQRHLGVQDLVDADADVLGISCESWSVPWAERLAGEARARKPGLWIWYGGDCAPRLLERGLLTWTPRDILFPGTAGFVEESFRRLLEHYASYGELDPEVLESTPGIVWWQKPDLRVSNPLPPYQPLAELASPYLEGDVAVDPDHDILWLRTSQGCISRCRYCSNSREDGVLHRIDLAPIARVGEEIELALRAGCKHVQTLSVGLNYDTDHMRAILALPFRNFESVRTIQSLAKFDRGQVDLFLGMAAGLFHLSFGVQSLSPQACRAAGRRHLTIDKIRDVLAPLRGHSLVELDLIFPLPGETLASFQRGVEALLDLGLGKIFVNQMTIGSELAFGREPQRWGFEVEEIGEMLFAVGCDGFPRRDVEQAQDWLSSLNGVDNMDSRRWLRLRAQTDPAHVAQPADAVAEGHRGAGGAPAVATVPPPLPGPLSQGDRPGTLRLRVEEVSDEVEPSEFFVARIEEGDGFFKRLDGTAFWYTTCPSATVREDVMALLLAVAGAIGEPPDTQNRARWTDALRAAFAGSQLSTRLALTIDAR